MTRIQVLPDVREDPSTALIRRWQVSVERLGQPSFQLYQASLDGKLLSMRLEWRGRPWREISAFAG